MTIRELKKQIDEYAGQSIDTAPLTTQLHQKLALAFSSFIFMLIALPLAVITHRREKTMNFGLAFLIVIVYYLLLIGFESLSLQGYLSPVISMWMPNIIFGAIGSFLTLKLCVS